jgi:hypothetical protein
MSVQTIDADGYLIPWAEDDEIIECGYDDPQYGDPGTWPDTCDADCWELGPAIPPDAVFEPYEPTAEDLEDYARWSDRLEALERLHELDEYHDRLAVLGGYYPGL